VYNARNYWGFGRCPSTGMLLLEFYYVLFLLILVDELGKTAGLAKTSEFVKYGLATDFC
jgi:hypothetical protein